MEEQRFDEQVGVEALLVLEASAPPWLGPHLDEAGGKPEGLGNCGFLQERCGPLFWLWSPLCSAILRLKHKRKYTVRFSKEEFKGPHEGHEDPDVRWFEKTGADGNWMTGAVATVETTAAEDQAKAEIK